MFKHCLVYLICVTALNTLFSQSNTPPDIEAIGNQIYCPLSQIPVVTSFNIVDPDDTQVEALHIQISSGYVEGEDILILTGFHPNITDTWNADEGKLTLRGVSGNPVSYSDVIAAVYDVVFESTSINVSGEKFFSFTIGDVNYLPSTGHYYEYISSPGITWIDARNTAETYTYYGLQGYLATLTSPEEAQLAGEQAAGTGWIGGSDEEVEGVWKWVTGPEAGTVFWNGGPNGSTPNYANWNNGEPNNLGNEDYVHITAPNIGIEGSWNDLDMDGDPAPSDYHPQGFIVEYGGMPGDPDVDISASTSISVNSIVTTIGASRCGQGQVTLEAFPVTGTILWFDAATGGNQVGSGTSFTTPVLNATTTYYALASANGCTEGLRQAVTATVLQIPEVQPFIILKNCDEDGVPDGFTNFNLTEVEDSAIVGDTSNVSVTYHSTLSDAETGTSIISPLPYNNSNGNTVYMRVESTNGCYKITEIELQVSTTSFPSGYIEVLEFCDEDGNNDGFYEFDLTQVSQEFLNQFPSGQNLSVHYYTSLEDAQLEQNEIINATNYINQTAFLENMYVRVESDDNGACFGIGQHLNLVVHPKPEFEVEQSEIYCFDGNPILLETFNPNGNFTYEWTDENGNIIGAAPQIMTDVSGAIIVTATSSEGCVSDPVVFNLVESSIADIDLDDITITDFSDYNIIDIDNTNNNLGIGDYEFALNDMDGPYQTEPRFSNVPAGEYTLYVRDQNGCGITSINVFVMGFPKFFTPNNDGINDTWNLKGWNQQFTSQSRIYIHDRYGKLLKQITPNAIGWDGTFNGQNLPADDFWFVADLVDFEGNKRLLKGHFSLVR